MPTSLPDPFAEDAHPKAPRSAEILPEQDDLRRNTNREGVITSTLFDWLRLTPTGRQRDRHRSRSASFVISALLTSCLGSGVIRAQTANLEGQVTDAGGGALVGAIVTAVSSSAAPAVTTTDAAGMYRFVVLAPGTYTVTVTMSGFRAERREDVVLDPADPRTLDVQLTVGGFAQQVHVIGVAPLSGTGISRERVPATVSILSGNELEDRQASSLADALHERLGPVTLEGATTNVIQPTLRFRGFTASPLLGLPQGIAVYQNGVRINEPFGDTVQFDLIPQFALRQVQLSAGAESDLRVECAWWSFGAEPEDRF